MDAHALTVNAVRDGPVSTLILGGDLDLPEAGGFLEQAALAVDDRTECLVFDLAGVTFLDCTGIRTLSIAARLAPSGCTVIIRSLSPMARRIVELLGLDLANLRELSPGWPPRSRAPRSSPGPRAARDYRVSEPGYRYQLIPRGECGPLTA
jgi:anti-anti-sigma factor